MLRVWHWICPSCCHRVGLAPFQRNHYITKTAHNGSKNNNLCKYSKSCNVCLKNSPQYWPAWLKTALQVKTLDLSTDRNGAKLLLLFFYKFHINFQAFPFPVQSFCCSVLVCYQIFSKKVSMLSLLKDQCVIFFFQPKFLLLSCNWCLCSNGVFDFLGLQQASL